MQEQHKTFLPTPPGPWLCFIWLDFILLCTHVRQTDAQPDTFTYIYYFSPQPSKLNQLTTQQVNKLKLILYCILEGIVLNMIHVDMNIIHVSAQSLEISGWWEEPVSVLVHWRWNTRESGDQCWLGLTGTGCHHL